MIWRHKCDLTWLKERRNYLTATDVKDLLPMTKTGRPRLVTDEMYLSVFARKDHRPSEDDCVSTGAAARGHILEPFAIECFNRFECSCLQHWDDVIIPKIDKGRHLAFSPDACDIPIVKDDVVESVWYGPSPRMIGEVKCYSPSKHLMLGMADKKTLEERWQIATAMACKPSIEAAYLILYNPSMEFQMFVHEYSRDDLASEIEVVNQIERNWIDFCTSRIEDILDASSSRRLMGNSRREQRIIEEIESERSVIQRGAGLGSSETDPRD